MKFTKMHGTGNDFIVINAIEEKLPKDLSVLSKKIADRHFGIGADQVLVVDKSRKADFKMIIFNNDGSQVEMCGNGIRCLARYVFEKGLTKNKHIEVETLGGIVKPQINGSRVSVNMGIPKFDTKDWKTKETINREFKINGKTFRISLISVGNPHCVIFVDRITNEMVHLYGPKIENSSSFPNRINVEFARIINDSEIEMRVWERGTGETLACGTGATATVIAAIKNKLTANKVTVRLLGGDLEIEWNGKEVYMSGPAEFVFEGQIEI
ncbi:MAG: diaminopimelate epimerase [Candidatus Levybacteria bacterium]|nr:diaminopimelate epimerase [Candidatus Levybacteria bacterium]